MVFSRMTATASGLLPLTCLLFLVLLGTTTNSVVSASPLPVPTHLSVRDLATDPTRIGTSTPIDAPKHKQDQVQAKVDGKADHIKKAGNEKVNHVKNAGHESVDGLKTAGHKKADHVKNAGLGEAPKHADKAEPLTDNVNTAMGRPDSTKTSPDDKKTGHGAAAKSAGKPIPVAASSHDTSSNSGSIPASGQGASSNSGSISTPSTSDSSGATTARALVDAYLTTLHWPASSKKPAYSLAFHSEGHCSGTLLGAAANDEPTHGGCATVVHADGVTVAKAKSVSAVDPGCQITWFREAGCKGPVDVNMETGKGEFAGMWKGKEGVKGAHCDSGSGEGFSYYRVTKKEL